MWKNAGPEWEERGCNACTCLLAYWGLQMVNWLPSYKNSYIYGQTCHYQMGKWSEILERGVKTICSFLYIHVWSCWGNRERSLFLPHCKALFLQKWAALTVKTWELAGSRVAVRYTGDNAPAPNSRKPLTACVSFVLSLISPRSYKNSYIYGQTCHYQMGEWSEIFWKGALKQYFYVSQLMD